MFCCLIKTITGTDASRRRPFLLYAKKRGQSLASGRHARDGSRVSDCPLMQKSLFLLLLFIFYYHYSAKKGVCQPEMRNIKPLSQLGSKLVKGF